MPIQITGLFTPSGGPGAFPLYTATDIDGSDGSANDILQTDGTSGGVTWVSLATAGISAVGHTHTESNITDLVKFKTIVTNPASETVTAVDNEDELTLTEGSNLIAIDGTAATNTIVFDVNQANLALTDGQISVTATDSLIGRDLTGAGVCTTITLNSTLSMTGSNALQRAALTGDVTAAAGSNTTAIAANVIVNNDINTSAAISLSKLADIAANSILGRNEGTTGAIEQLTGTEVTAMLDDFVGDSGAGGTAGLVPAPGAGDAAAGKYLDSDGTWTVPAGGGGAPVDATYIVQTADGTLTNEQALGALATGIVKNTTTTGVLSIAVDGTDYISELSVDPSPQLGADLDVNGNDIAMGDLSNLFFGASNDVTIAWDTAGTNDYLAIAIQGGAPATSGFLSIMEGSNYGHANRRPNTTPADPTLRLYGLGTTATHWLDLKYDSVGGNAEIASGAGDIDFVPAGNLTYNGTEVSVVGHTHTESDITDLQSYALQSITLTAGEGLSGGGDLSANRSFALALSELSADTIAGGDFIPFQDITDDGNNKITWTNLQAGISITESQISDLQSYVLSGTQLGTAVVDVFKQKSGSALEFRGLKAGSTDIVLVENASDIEISLDPTQITISELGNVSASSPTAHDYLVYNGTDNWIAQVNKFDATTAPTANEDSGDGYAVGSRWIDITNDKEYVCLDSTATAAVWTETTGTGGGGGAHDLLDGSTVQDSTAYTVARGSLIVGKTGPTWDGLAVGAANDVLGTDGTDVAWVTSTGTGNNVRAAGPTFTSDLTLSAAAAAVEAKILDSNSNEVLSFLGATGAVNYVLMYGGATGVGPTIGGYGEANADLNLAASGSGTVNLLNDLDMEDESIIFRSLSTVSISATAAGASLAISNTVASASIDIDTAATGTLNLGATSGTTNIGNDGNVTFGTSTLRVVSPATDVKCDLGSSSLQWADFYMEGTIYAGTTGILIGSANTEPLGFWGVGAVVTQPTTAGAAATFTANSGTAVNDASTFDGYTLKQVVKALRNMGLLA